MLQGKGACNNAVPYCNVEDGGHTRHEMESSTLGGVQAAAILGNGRLICPRLQESKRCAAMREPCGMGKDGLGEMRDMDGRNMQIPYVLVYSPSVRAECCGCSAAQDRTRSDELMVIFSLATARLRVDVDQVHTGLEVWMSGNLDIDVRIQCPNMASFQLRRLVDTHPCRYLGWIGSGALHALICQGRAQ